MALDAPHSVTRLTRSSFNEHALFSPSEGRIVWMSKRENEGADWWEMLPDGTYVQPPTRTAEAGLNACLVQGGAGLPEETSRIMERSARAGTQSALVEYYSEEK